MKRRYHFQLLLKFCLPITILTLVLAGCSKFVDINDDPNNPTRPDLPLMLPATQLSLVSNMDEVNTGASSLVQHFGATPISNLSRWNQTGLSFQNAWVGFYTQTIPDLETIIRVGTEESQWGYVAVAMLEKAYLYSIMVDLWGDIPYSQAAGEYNNPVFDKGADIYDELFLLIDNALSIMDQGFNIPASSDIIYQGSKEAWVRMANSLKLKLYNQIRLVDTDRAKSGIQQLLSSGAPLIDNNEQDFKFQFGTTISPEARHPWFAGWYNANRGGSGGYVSMPLIDHLKSHDDPRLRYYFFRQNERVGLANSMNSEGYYGRYPGDATPAPADLNTKTLVGIYPAAGLYDNGRIPSLPSTFAYLTNEGATTGTTNNSFKVALFTSGDGTGGGVLPMITNFMVNFIRAEASITLGTGEDAKQLLQAAVTAQMNLVSSVSGANGGLVIPPATIQGFVSRLGTQYDGLATDAEKLDLIMTQKWVAMLGNGIEAYNDYRRTALPVMTELLAPLDEYPMRFFYAETEMNSNESVIENRDIIQRAQQITPVFWDIN